METKHPDNTALRTALWRALHVELDDQPHIIEDEVGLDLIKPGEGWQERPDMKYTKRLRASIVGRTRFIEDVAKEQIASGITQYVILGSGLDSFAQRNTAIASAIHIYEIDQPDTIAWKAARLIECGYGIPDTLQFVPVDFEEISWWNELLTKGFDVTQKTIVACIGVTLYLTREAIRETLNKLTLLAPGSSVAIAFYLPIELLDEEDQPMQEIANKGAKESGTPFVSFFTTSEVIKMSVAAGLKDISIFSTKEIKARYFNNRTDNLLPASGEFFLVANT